MRHEELAYAKEILEARKHCADNGDCYNCEFMGFCKEHDLPFETTKMIETLIAYIENER